MKDAAMKDETAAEQATDRAELINAVGLHARPFGQAHTACQDLRLPR